MKLLVLFAIIITSLNVKAATTENQTSKDSAYKAWKLDSIPGQFGLRVLLWAVNLDFYALKNNKNIIGLIVSDDESAIHIENYSLTTGKLNSSSCKAYELNAKEKANLTPEMIEHGNTLIVETEDGLVTYKPMNQSEIRELTRKIKTYNRLCM
ncbi:MAG: hypothetical protein V4596_13295 [Bdellovibrionota bacterium]